MKKTVQAIAKAGFFIFFLLSYGSCQKKDSNLTLTMVPDTITILNAKFYTCLDSYLLAHSANPEQVQRSASPGVALFKSLTVSWKGSSPLTILGIRFTSSSPLLKTKLDVTLAGDELNTLVASGDSKACFFCLVPVPEAGKTTEFTITDSENFVHPKSGDSGYKGCGPIIGGIKSGSEDEGGDIVVPMKVTIFGYSYNSTTKEVTNEYGSFNTTVRFQSAP